MATKGAPLGNKNASKNKIWSDAIRKEVLSRKRLDKLAKKLVDKAEEGDIQCLREVGDRIEGKPAQSIVGEDGGPIILKITNDDRSVL